MNERTNIITNITNNNIFSKYKYLIINPSYTNYGFSNIEPIPSYVILSSSAYYIYLLITTHCVNIQTCTTKDEVSLPNNTNMSALDSTS